MASKSAYPCTTTFPASRRSFERRANALRLNIWGASSTACLGFLLLLGGLSSAQATDYYVDVAAGKDHWSGTSAAPTEGTSVGPWQTLARVSAAALQPGDRVLLKCGQVWREPLAVSSSGSDLAPITITSHPVGCSDRPIIDGTKTLPSVAWETDTDGVYRASLNPNLLGRDTVSDWGVYSAKGDAQLISSTDCPTSSSCATIKSGSGSRNSIVYSRPFRMEQGAQMQTSFRMKAPAGTLITVSIRRNGSPYDSAGLATQVMGAGVWKEFSLSFVSRNDMANARLDFEVPPGGVQIAIDEVSIRQEVDEPLQVFQEGTFLNIAHFPNWDPYQDSNSSPYLTVPADSDSVMVEGRASSTFAQVDSVPGLPSGATFEGANIVLRPNGWTIEERKVVSHANGRIYFNEATKYPLTAGWGYFLTGLRWMLDSPGEWYFDAATSTLFVQTTDSAPPDARISFSHILVGIDINRTKNIVINGISVRGMSTAIDIEATKDVEIRNCIMIDSDQHAIDAAGSIGARILSNTIARTGGDSISGYGETNWNATGALVSENVISEAGVRVANGVIVSLPRPFDSSVRVGDNAQVVDNRIQHVAGNGMRLGAQSTAQRNHVDSACMVLDDCAGIYANLSGAGSLIQQNVIENVIGGKDGNALDYTQAVGIYLDDFATGVSVEGNTVTNADFGIQIHNAASNIIHGNVFYGNRRSQMWLQENSASSNALGDLHGNQITRNHLVSTDINLAPFTLKTDTKFASTDRFAVFTENVYSTLLTPLMAVEETPKGRISYSFPQWKMATNSDGTARNQDVDGKQVAPPSYTVIVQGGNLIPNGSLQDGSKGWHPWAPVKPVGQAEVVDCGGFTCLKLDTEAGQTLLSSPHFSVSKGQWYRVTFDFRSEADNLPVVIRARRGGGGSNGYELLGASTLHVKGTTNWQRISYTFKSLLSITAGDPVTLDMGARIDFDEIAPQQTIYVANLEMVPIAPVDLTVSTDLLKNPTHDNAYVDCPDWDLTPEKCGKYVDFEDGEPLLWPVTLGPFESKIVYALDATQIDTDKDNIPDDQDFCPSTEEGVVVDSRGCSFSQATD